MDIISSLCSSDNPSIAWRARRLLRGEDPGTPTMLALRDQIRTSDDARRLLSLQHPNGTIPAAPYQKWMGPHWTLVSLAMIAYPPGDKQLLPILDQVHTWLFSDRHLNPPSTQFYPDQPERPRRCASQEGNAIWYSLQLGLENERTPLLVERLCDFQWPDGGWNCDKNPQAHISSFVETLIPLRALWHYGQKYNHARAMTAAERAAEFLLQHRLLFRCRDGSLVQIAWGGDLTRIHYPIQFYDLLIVLQVMAEMGKIGHPRCGPALEMLAAKQLPGGGFPLEYKNAVPAQTLTSRGSLINWGPSGKTIANPRLSVDALWVLQQAGINPK